MTKRTLFLVVLLLSVTALLSAGGCSAPTPSNPPATAGSPADPADAKEEKGGEEGGVADLDKTEDELFRIPCEHHIPAYQCDECRYSVGVVKLAYSLIHGGLVKLERVERHPLEAPVALTGEIRFDERQIAHLSPQVPGIIRRVMIGLGQHVAAGQPLVEIDSLDLGQAQGDYLEARATHELARRNFERQAELLADKITSEKEFLAARKEFEETKIRVKAAGEKLLRLGLEAKEIDKLAEDQLGPAKGRLVLRAPFAGQVLDMHAVAGELAQPGESMLLVGDLSTLWLWADLYETNLAEVSSQAAGGGAPVDVKVRAFPNETFPGRVDLVGATMDPNSRTVKVRIAVPNLQGKLRPGMFASAGLRLAARQMVLAVPKVAVLSDEGRIFVFRHHQGEFYVRREVVLGAKFGPWVEIKSGLEAGQTIVADGSFLLKSDVLRSKMGAGCAD